MDRATKSDTASLFSSLADLSFFKPKSGKITVPISQNDLSYKMTHKRRGYAVIFNHIDFDPDIKRAERFDKRDPGTTVDCQRLQETFLNMGFEVIIRDDQKLTFRKVESTLEEVRKKDFTECDCLIVCVLSHGGTADRIFAYDACYSTDLIVGKFTPDKCRSLAGKPKLIILNLCRGQNLDPGIKVEVEVETDGNDKSFNGCEMATYRLPLYADFLFAYSTIASHVSFRNSSGSCYVKALCKLLNNHAANTDISTLLTCVNRLVAVEYEVTSKDPKLSKKKQMPCFTSMLTRLLTFTPK